MTLWSRAEPVAWSSIGLKQKITNRWANTPQRRELSPTREVLTNHNPHRLLVITAAVSEVKSPYPYPGNPNRITQSLIAVLAGLRVQFLCAETHELGEELIASYLYQVHLYHWLETNDYGRFLAENDL